MARQWTDNAIEKSVDDRFGRSQYASHAAQLIDATHSWEGSAVFGLTGSWGSGKTSLLNMIIEALDEVKSPEDVPRHAVVRFTPWATHDVTGVLNDFYASLASALPKEGRPGARQRFGKLLRVASPAAKFIPLAGEAIADYGAMAADKLTEVEPWDVAFAEAAQMLRENGRPILVVVDDIDRLQGDELLTVLKVIRLLGRFPGVQYLLAYDEDSLAHTLTAAHAARDDGAARRYIEKIVQYPLPVPPLLDVQLHRRLSLGLEEVVTSRRAIRSLGPMHRIDMVRPAMRAMLTTPRAIDRYVAQVDYELGLHRPGEIDDEDVIILALLRTAFPSLYSSLPAHQEQLVTGNGTELDAGGSDIEAFNSDSLLEHVLASERPYARQILTILFPKLVHKSAPTTRGRIGTREHFGRYFAMGVLAEHDIADAEVRAAVRLACDGDGSTLVAMLKTPDPDLAALTFDKTIDSFQTLWHQTSEAARDTSTLALLHALLPVIDDLSDPGTPLFSSVRDSVIRWIGRDALPKVSNDVEPAHLISTLASIESADTHAFVLMQAAQMQPARGAEPDWWKSVVEAALPAVAAAFIDHLRERDTAQTERQKLIAFFQLAELAGVSMYSVRSKLAECIALGEFGIDDLAGRYIVLEITNELLVNQEGFNRVAPRIDTEWYDTDPEDFAGGYDFGVNDTWENRRRFAAGRVSRPTDLGTQSTVRHRS